MSHLTISLQKALASDIPLIYQLAEKIWHYHYTPIIGKNQVDYMLNNMYSKESLTRQMEIEGQVFHFILLDEKSIGFISTSQKGSDCFIHKFYIDQDEQGKGIGSHVFQNIQQLYPTSKSFTLTVNRKNYKSINFYFKIGFKIDHVDDFDIGNGYYMNDFIMKKNIL